MSIHIFGEVVDPSPYSTGLPDCVVTLCGQTVAIAETVAYSDEGAEQMTCVGCWVKFAEDQDNE